MKKGWISKKIHENCMGMHFTRWYIKSPAGNFYQLYRSCYGDSLFLTQDVNDCDKALRMNQIVDPSKLNEYGICTFQGAISKIYEIEESGAYDKKLSDDILNSEECQMLFSSPQRSISYCSC